MKHGAFNKKIVIVNINKISNTKQSIKDFHAKGIQTVIPPNPFKADLSGCKYSMLSLQTMVKT